MNPSLRLLRIAGLTAVLGFSVCHSFAQDDQNRRRGGDGTDRGDRGGRGNFDPQEMQTRMLAQLRERFEVTDDEEWKLISQRVLAVSEARRATGGGFGGFMGRGGPQGGPQGGSDRGGRSGRTGTDEVAALSSALRDKLPDAEIKSRLERLRDMRKNNEAKLAKAQEDLRAVLSVRQEATAVVFGLLP